MRVIKLYEDFSKASNIPNSINDIVKKRVAFIKKIKSNVEDIFVELLDNNFLVDVNVTNNNNKMSGYFKCEILIVKQEHDVPESPYTSPESFNFIDIKEYVMMFESYINEYDYENLKYNLPYFVDDLDSAFISYVKISVFIKL